MIKSFTKKLSVNNNTSSPTFNIVNEYKDRNKNSVSLLAIVGCGTNHKMADTKAPKNLDPVPYGNTITEAELKTHLYTYASDEFEGRDTGEPGQKKAVAYLRDEYKNSDNAYKKFNWGSKTYK